MASSEEVISYSENVENIRNLLASRGTDMQVRSVTFSPGSNAGDNYMSVVKKSVVNSDDSGKSKIEEEINLKILNLQANFDRRF